MPLLERKQHRLPGAGLEHAVDLRDQCDMNRAIAVEQPEQMFHTAECPHQSGRLLQVVFAIRLLISHLNSVFFRREGNVERNRWRVRNFVRPPGVLLKATVSPLYPIVEK
ncbi:hypothetical protein M3A49_33505 [Paraburkholderia sp. CNPSo 3076]|uniref:hypothetical protein n=1 Tax=Paraburkholderia sp. CNPSo 3076 TaxID=2940936 RepID=UPI00225A297B|nr:hypothetical protein [Paraburkholderia sp. CNPSo 3076]MCX5544329.1 hypothetical protein [Paraburkholderia sp. CNPSo 3076]